MASSEGSHTYNSINLSGNAQVHLGDDYIFREAAPQGLFERIGKSFGSTVVSSYARVIQGDVIIGQLHINVRDMMTPVFHFTTALLSGATRGEHIALIAPEGAWQTLATLVVSAATLILTVQHRVLLGKTLSFTPYLRRTPIAMAHAMGAPKLNIMLARYISRFGRAARYR